MGSGGVYGGFGGEMGRDLRSGGIGGSVGGVWGGNLGVWGGYGGLVGKSGGLGGKFGFWACNLGFEGGIWGPGVEHGPMRGRIWGLGKGIWGLGGMWRTWGEEFGVWGDRGSGGGGFGGLRGSGGVECGVWEGGRHNHGGKQGVVGWILGCGGDVGVWGGFRVRVKEGKSAGTFGGKGGSPNPFIYTQSAPSPSHAAGYKPRPRRDEATPL